MKYILYHSRNNEFNLNHFKLENTPMWFATNPEYSNLFGTDELYEFTMNLNNVFDATDLGAKQISISKLYKYLKSKNIDYDDTQFILDKVYDNNYKNNFWGFLMEETRGNLIHDIFYSGYDAISLIEYGFSKLEKDKTFLVRNPKESVISYKKINNSTNEMNMRKNKKELYRIINEEVSEFDFLGLDQDDKERTKQKIVESRDFQIQFVNDVISDFDNKEKFSCNFVYNSKRNDTMVNHYQSEGLNVSYDLDIDYQYQGDVVGIYIILETDNMEIEDRVNNDWSKNFNIKFFDEAGAVIKFDWLIDNEGLYQKFVESLISEYLPKN